MLQILIGGDVCPMGGIQDAFIKGDALEIFHDLTKEIAKADLSIVNLECPLVSQETPIAKAGPVFGSNIQCIKGFAAAKWSVLNLANNHSYDHGTSGLRETMLAIKNAELNFVGAGLDIEEAQVPYVAQVKNKRIVIYSMAEREFSIADENTPGANPLDLINFVRAIRQYKQQGIFIVLIHGGKEFYPYPSPEMVRNCRFLVEMGADAVICCHAHCPLPWEQYAGRPIVYGLGNLIFEATRRQSDSWYMGYLARLTVDDGHIGFEAIPYYQSLTTPGAQKMDNIAQKQFLEEMRRKSALVTDLDFIKNQWLKYCRHEKANYLSRLFAYNRVMHKLRSMVMPILNPKKAMLLALLMVQCETHREILNTIFRDKRLGK